MSLNLKKTIKRIINANLLTDYEFNNIFENYQNILQKYFTFIVRSNSNYSADNFYHGKKKRILILLLLKMCTLLFTLRCIVNILWPTPLIRDITCNAFHYLGNSVLVNIALAAGAFSGNLCAGMTVIFFNSNGLSPLLTQINAMKLQNIGYKLNRKYRQKLCRRIDLISSLLSTQLIPIWLTYTIVFCIPTFIGYFDPELNFTSTGILLNL